ncbi:hypothetical protein B0H16DRAFT_1639904 [Mycena metata]|uniref:Uncharacterized protein n=1 Tax=Mycena metata TaxID=1033252 RepID=A0AAD7DYY6_9AGAR|nr:hypothetical protein B0H16DRAFT_1639904 [Mycena metata]
MDEGVEACGSESRCESRSIPCFFIDNTTASRFDYRGHHRRSHLCNKPPGCLPSRLRAPFRHQNHSSRTVSSLGILPLHLLLSWPDHPHRACMQCIGCLGPATTPPSGLYLRLAPFPDIRLAPFHAVCLPTAGTRTVVRFRALPLSLSTLEIYPDQGLACARPQIQVYAFGDVQGLARNMVSTPLGSEIAYRSACRDILRVPLLHAQGSLDVSSCSGTHSDLAPIIISFIPHSVESWFAPRWPRCESKQNTDDQDRQILVRRVASYTPTTAGLA